MKRTVLYTCSVLFLAALGLCLVDARRAAACNQGSDVAAWHFLPQSATANAQGAFSTILTLDWAFREVPFIGGAEAGTGNTNVAGSPTYTPAYFYPTTCLGGINISVAGKLSNPTLDGLVRSRGWVWDSGNPAPYDDDIHSLRVLHR